MHIVFYRNLSTALFVSLDCIYPFGFPSLILFVFKVPPVCVKETRYQIGLDMTTFDSTCRMNLHQPLLTRNIQKSTRRYKPVKLEGENLFFHGKRKKAKKHTNCIVEAFCGTGTIGLGYKLIINAKNLKLTFILQILVQLIRALCRSINSKIVLHKNSCLANI